MKTILSLVAVLAISIQSFAGCARASGGDATSSTTSTNSMVGSGGSGGSGGSSPCGLCSDAINGTSPPCQGASSIAFAAVLECFCGPFGMCSADCGSSWCSDIDANSDCKACSSLLCSAQFDACKSDVGEVVDPPYDCALTGLPACAGSEAVVDCNGDAKCPGVIYDSNGDTEDALCRACCVDVHAGPVMSYCTAP